MMFYLLLIFAVAIFVVIAVGYFRRKTARELEVASALRGSINRIPNSEAQAKVEALLAGDTWETQRALEPEKRFGPLANTFFSHYSKVVRTDFPSVTLQRPAPDESSAEDFLKIGNSLEALTIVLDPKADTIVEFDTAETVDKGVAFTSVYHYLIFNDSLNDESA